MNRLIAASRCFSPRSIRRHSDGRDDPRDDVERPGSVDALAVGVHGEGDAHRQDVDLGQRLALLQLAVLERRQLGEQRRRGGPRRAVGRHQLVPRVCLGAHVCHRHRPTIIDSHVRTVTTLCRACELCFVRSPSPTLINAVRHRGLAHVREIWVPAAEWYVLRRRSLAPRCFRERRVRTLCDAHGCQTR